ncbi:MAG: N-acetyl sugar amidotransferase [Selenomonas ruminantium]|uniref:N-acetyl sugar amidotransferase n=2 Tax=Selenomonas ruminantium TaxID=971 RepID=A0A927ZVL4_SELRU|nr:N-acetyl sugar amidotransferase [Selenomonas ruminantium]
MKFCKKCIMPNTRPGITFNEEGVCIACQNNERKKLVNWDARMEELKALCDKYRRKQPGQYDCIIAVSGGKDSHYQVHIMKEVMKMNPLLITVEDFFTMTEAGKHNVKNISEAFGCNMISFKPNRRAAKVISRYMFEKYGRPLWYVDRLLYTVPLYYAAALNIPLLVYGENVSYEYGGVDDKETYSAREQVFNGVAPDVELQELVDAGVPMDELAYLEAPSRDMLDKLEPIYLSYFVEWNGVKNYEFAKRRGFKDLTHEWDRTNHIENFNQIDSYGYLLNAWMKFPKYGHAYATDYAARWVRYGMLTREEAIKLAEDRDHNIDPKIIEDFCGFTGMTTKEFYEALDKLYNKELFAQNSWGQWRLKQENIEERRNPQW